MWDFKLKFPFINDSIKEETWQDLPAWQCSKLTTILIIDSLFQPYCSRGALHEGICANLMKNYYFHQILIFNHDFRNEFIKNRIAWFPGLYLFYILWWELQTFVIILIGRTWWIPPHFIECLWIHTSIQHPKIWKNTGIMLQPDFKSIVA